MSCVYVVATQVDGVVDQRTEHAIRVAESMGMPIHLLIFAACERVDMRGFATHPSLTAITILVNPCFATLQAEQMAAAWGAHMKDKSVHAVLMTQGVDALNVLPRIAADLAAEVLTYVTRFTRSSNTVEQQFSRRQPVCSTTILAWPCVLSVLPAEAMVVSPPVSDVRVPVDVVLVDALPATGLTAEPAMVAPNASLSQANVVVGAGRHIGNCYEQSQIFTEYCDAMGASAVTSYAAQQGGYFSHVPHVGQTGQVIQPALYLACAISGAVQHMTGVIDSQVIVAINASASAPIVWQSDYSLIMDWQAALSDISERIAISYQSKETVCT